MMVLIVKMGPRSRTRTCCRNFSPRSCDSFRVRGLAKFVTLLTSATPFRATIISLNVMKNPIGDDGLAALMTAVKGTNIQTITGITEGQTSIDYSYQGLTPMDLKTLAADIEFTPFNATVNEIRLDLNPLTGCRFSSGKPYDQFDKTMDGFIAICEALKESSVSKLSLASCGLGPDALSTLANAMSDIAGAAMNFLDVSKNRIDADSARALLQAIQSSKLQTIVIGMKDPISISVGGSDTVAAMTALDYSNQDIGLGELMMISSLIIPFSAALDEITLSSTGSKLLVLHHTARFQAEVDASGPKTYNLKGLQGGADPNLNLSAMNLGPADLEFLCIVFTTFSKFTAALSEVDLSGANIKESDLVALRSAAPDVSFVH